VILPDTRRMRAELEELREALITALVGMGRQRRRAEQAEVYFVRGDLVYPDGSLPPNYGGGAAFDFSVGADGLP
jgi:hypothetical protein